MKYIGITLSFLLMACSSTKDKKSDDKEVVSNEAFKKARPLKASEVNDFYVGNSRALSPALEDETTDRHTSEEAAAILPIKDPLGQMALLCKRGQFTEAFEVASRSFNSYQKIASYWNQVANCHLNQGAQRKALLFYNKALEVSPNYVPALNNIGVLYSRQGQDQKALVAFERAYKESRFTKTPRYNLAKLYLIYGLSEQALPLLRGLLDSSPQDMDLLNLTASAYFLQADYQKAISHFQRIPAAQWTRPEVGLNLAWTLSKLGQHDNARKVFNGVARPKSGKMARYYSTVQAQLGDKG